jgi:extracellular elastinolytic metalloproteinase
MVHGTARSSIHWVGVLVACGLAAGASLMAQADPANVARRWVDQHQQELGLTGSDIRELAVSSTVRSSHNGITHVYLQQRYRGIDVNNALLTVSVRGSDVVSTSSSRFVANIASKVSGDLARKAAAEAAAHAAGHLNLDATGRFDVLWRKGGAADATVIAGAGVAERPIEAQLVWAESDNGIRLAWKVEIDEVGGEHAWEALVDAETGESLGIVDLVVHDSVDGIAAAVGRASSDPTSASATPSFSTTDGERYRVFPIPSGGPSESDHLLVSNAADPAASPFGWHDTNGAPGAEFTMTRGNNVHAYTDIDANNVADTGSDPDGGGTLTFDFPINLGQNPETYRPGAVTNLFYWNNVIHDVMYGYGFDEPSGNFQVNNYGKGGLANDDVRAEAQDGSGENNANFFTPADGQRPRMQMFIWRHPLPNLVSVASGGAAGDHPASRGTFGAQLFEIGPVSGQVVVVNDGGGVSPTDACEPLAAGSLTDAIALIDRGTCEFGFKALNAENAGAAAVIIANNAPGNPVTMGPGVVGNQVTIAAVMVTQDAGNLFKANAPFNATLRANPLTSINRDSDLDAGIITHEYGHGISNRLTGGPTVTGCLSNAEQMGEGWSDFFGITLTAQQGDNPLVQRGVGNYVIFEGRDGDGIRPTPYSTDMDVNPSTYAFVANPAISQPHGIGYVWATMVWEMYWNLVDRYGFNPNIYDSWQTGGNNLALQLVIDGLKFQPCRPGFVDGRNAILQADTALTDGANQCEIWRAFAKRGLGVNANQGLSTNRNDGVENFDLPASCLAATFGGFSDPVLDAPNVNTVDAGDTVPLKFSLVGGGSSLLMDSQAVDCTTLVALGEAPSALETPGDAGLKRKGNEYHLNWKTDPSWAGSCRRVTIRIPSATDAVAFFRFE